ncbi:hypothetical protein H6P81_002520 [Aristolochia fimbriata]|uniref:Histone-lysine N-methyltransferase ASHH3 n=1 Tax=Aristolochia fimbriata TaxID=158543 RepID=A0AAV7FE37_ARIFI|nr:hypothetical protein H6P81_002520 [Aristolochia fimbriata]
MCAIVYLYICCYVFIQLTQVLWFEALVSLLSFLGVSIESERMPAMKKNLDGGSPGDLFKKLLQELDPANSMEFQLPDWLTRKKPLNYTSIRRNVYLTKRIKKRTEDDGIFCFCSPSSGSSNVCGRDCQCGMLLSSCSSSCKCGNSCLNKPFQNRPVKKMKLVETEKCGYGLIADEDIKKGEFVIEYVGEVIDDKTCEERLWNMKHRGETNFYLCEINRDMVIDATYKGNKSRYINHSCQPNTEMQKWRIDGETRIGIFATCAIKKGEDLTYDYRFVQFGADQDCHCGTLGCRQKLGSKPSKPKICPSDTALKLVASEDYPTHRLDNGFSHHTPRQRLTCLDNCIGQMIQIWRPHEDRCYMGYISHFNCTSKEHTIVFEDRNVEVLDLSKEMSYGSSEFHLKGASCGYGFSIVVLNLGCKVNACGCISSIGHLRVAKEQPLNSIVHLQCCT